MESILIVDDEPEICLLLSKLLRKEGYEIETSNSLKDSIEVFEKKEFSIVLLDLHLPDGAGFSIIPKLKKINRDVKIIIISAYTGSSERKMAAQKGADDFVAKPLSRVSILNAITKPGLSRKIAG